MVAEELLYFWYIYPHKHSFYSHRGPRLFQRHKGKPIPLAIAAGGGGLGLGRFTDTGSQHGQAINMSRHPVTGQMYGSK